MRLAALLISTTLLLAACGSTGVEPPSLQPRPGEQVDPRIPVDRPINDRPATRALVERLQALTAQARSGESGFNSAITAAQRAAASAGAPQTESWIAAQELLSAAIEARGPASAALGAIDSLGATLLSEQGGLSPADKQAIHEAARIVGAIDERQAAAVASVRTKLGN